MHLQQTHQAVPPAGAGDVGELLALLEGEPGFKVQDRVIAQPEKTIQEQGIETLLGLIRNRRSLHLRYSSGFNYLAVSQQKLSDMFATVL